MSHDTTTQIMWIPFQNTRRLEKKKLKSIGTVKNHFKLMCIRVGAGWISRDSFFCTTTSTSSWVTRVWANHTIGIFIIFRRFCRPILKSETIIIIVAAYATVVLTASRAPMLALDLLLSSRNNSNYYSNI